MTDLKQAINNHYKDVDKYIQSGCKPKLLPPSLFVLKHNPQYDDNRWGKSFKITRLKDTL